MSESGVATEIALNQVKIQSERRHHSPTMPWCFRCYRVPCCNDTALENAELTRNTQIRGTFTAKVVKVYDGDTITVVVRMYDELRQHSMRLAHIDAPEIRGGSAAETRAAQFSRDMLAEHILGQIVRIEITGQEKYGRLLGTVYAIRRHSILRWRKDYLDMNQWMLDNDYAVPYEGGTKPQFSASRKRNSSNAKKSKARRTRV